MIQTSDHFDNNLIYKGLRTLRSKDKPDWNIVFDFLEGRGFELTYPLILDEDVNIFEYRNPWYLRTSFDSDEGTWSGMLLFSTGGGFPNKMEMWAQTAEFRDLGVFLDAVIEMVRRESLK
jgi:hypothetical protein